MVARDAEVAGSARPEAVTAASVADRGADSHGGHSMSGGTGGPPVAPWDMAGDWGTASGTGASDAWAADPPETADFLEGTGFGKAPASRTAPGSRRVPGP